MTSRQIDRAYKEAIEGMAACLHANKVAPWPRYVSNAAMWQAKAIGLASRPNSIRRQRIRQ